MPKDKKRARQVNLDYEFTSDSLRDRVLSKTVLNEQLFSDESRKLGLSYGLAKKAVWSRSKEKKEKSKMRSKSGVISSRYQWNAPPLPQPTQSSLSTLDSKACFKKMIRPNV